MKGNCRLYGTEGELRSSHIIPKFVIDYLKRTGSKYIRNFGNPNQRLQDGLKRNYLSHEAEQVFSIKEKWFAENFFKPFMENGKHNFQYDENLYYFLISVLWRGLLHQMENSTISKDTTLNILKDVELDWKNYLAGETIAPQFSNVNLFLTDNIKSNTTEIIGLDYYFTRIIDFTIISDDKGDHIYVYGKFLKFIFWSTIKDPRNINYSIVQIKQFGGIINFPQNFQDGFFMEALLLRAKQISELSPPNDQQLQKITDEVSKSPRSFINSEAGRSIMNDWGLDNLTNYKISGRNEPCPCGSGIKFKKCHGFG
ncbi:YecA family protein [Empedobacter sp. UBA6745]|uniref:YecA family protein n=1 Tax=Empedobacter sp. UBA6745 TaxID=1946447 RepID=UPI0025B82C26|nr:SEC-C domain-containing protein [Empedobacter sp. UBA6745]